MSNRSDKTIKDKVNKAIIIVVEPGEHNFSAYTPNYPGVISTGKTQDETIANMKEAIIFHLSEQFPEPKKKKSGISKADRERIKRIQEQLATIKIDPRTIEYSRQVSREMSRIDPIKGMREFTI